MSEETIGFHDETTADNAVDHTETELLMSHSSMEDKLAQRQQLNDQIEAFIASGGKISAIAPNVMADPPKKPENKYGSHPI